MRLLNTKNGTERDKVIKKMAKTISSSANYYCIKSVSSSLYYL